MPSGLLVVLRLNETNKEVHDYFVLPPKPRTGPYVHISDNSVARQKAVRVESLDKLIRVIKTQLRTRRHMPKIAPVS